jgi:hypothetical protein
MRRQASVVRRSGSVSNSSRHARAGSRRARDSNGRLGGLARTERKALAARANGKRGGRHSNAAAESQVMNEIFGSEPAQP